MPKLKDKRKCHLISVAGMFFSYTAHPLISDILYAVICHLKTLGGLVCH